MGTERTVARGRRESIEGLLARHSAFRHSTLNLIASENVLSPAVSSALTNDLVGRYADYVDGDIRVRRYKGTQYVRQLEESATELAVEAFGAPYVELRATSGHLAGVAVVAALCGPGDLILELGREGGGHREAERLALASAVPLSVKQLPFDPFRYNVDAAESAKAIRALRPRMVILGSSNFLFPHPVAEIAEAVRDTGNCVLVYDASHVMGFLAASRFQSPLDEGADIVFGSTHKTLPGPQGGIIFSRNADLMKQVSDVLYPALVTNHHPFRIPALALSIIEMLEWGSDYAAKTTANANYLAGRLVEHGIPSITVGGAFTESHTILLQTGDICTGEEAATRLEQAGIISTSAALPEELGGQGVRVGSQEVTRRGANDGTMEDVAGVMADAILGRQPSAALAEQSAAIAKTLQTWRFTWEGM